VTPAVGPSDGSGGAGESDPAPAQASSREKHLARRHSRWHTAVALSIATVSVLGAISSWRIESHATAANGADQNAVAATLTDSRLVVESRAEAQQSQEAFFRYERLSDEAYGLVPAGCPAHPVTVVDYDAYVVCQLEQAIFDGANDAYASVSARSYNVEGLATDLVAEQGFEEDYQQAPYEATARSERVAEDRLLRLTLLLVLSLGLLTVAHLARRRHVLLRTAIPGWILMAISAAFLVIWEI
jgi:hypothetical protein